MKKALLALAVVAASASAFAQGTIDFINRSVGTAADPTVQYNIPIYVQGGRATGTGAGNLPGGVTVGLFLAGAADNATPILTTPLRTGTATAAQFFAISPQTATITGSPAGANANLIVRAWQGPSYAAAKAGGGQFGEFAFTSLPLGGTPPGGGLPVPTPGTNFGPESGAGVELTNVPEPTTIALAAVGIGALLLRRRK